MKTTPFFEQLESRCREIDSLLCVGLDPHPSELGGPEAQTAEAAAAFCLRIIEATSAVAAAYKPNAAFFEAYGAQGAAALERVVAAVPAGIPVLLDAKRGDIGSTAAAYATAAFSHLQAHAITLSPYMGGDSLEPFLVDATRGSFVLCKTSNPGSNEVQTLPLAAGGTVFQQVAQMAQQSWNKNKNVGLVVGATDTDALTKARAAAPDLWILAPGVGFQGGDLSLTIKCAMRPDGLGILLPVSRGISRDPDPAAAALRLRDAINAAKESALASAPNPAAGALTPAKAMAPFQADFIEFAMGLGVLKFGSFTLKSGRNSPYFFNAGLFKTGAALGQLGQFYAKAILASGVPFDVLFGPAYKGIPLVSSVAIAMSNQGQDVDFCFNRKVAKDHGEGGLLVGATVADRKCLVVDDVITAGTAIREAAGILTSASASLAGVVISVDRQEKTGAEGAGDLSATQQVERDLGVPVVSIVTLSHLLEWAKGRPEMSQHLDAIAQYREAYGVE